MIASLADWLRTLIAGAFLVSLLLALAPEGKGTAAVRFLAGVLMTLLLILPLTKQKLTHLTELTGWEWPRISEIEADAASRADRIYSSFIQRETEEYIWSAAGKLGIKTLGVSLTLDTDAPCPCPREVSLRGVYSASQQEALSMLLESELGLSPERQHWSNANGD